MPSAIQDLKRRFDPSDAFFKVILGWVSAWDKPPVVLEQHVTEGYLDMVHSKETTRAGVSAEPKPHIAGVDGGQLPLGGLPRFLAHS